MKGYWNGEPAEFKGIEYEVKEPKVPTYWYARFVGEKRQGIEVRYQGDSFIIDNQHGDGFYKLTRGMGSPRCAHKSLSNISDNDFTYIPDEQVNKILDRDMLAVERESHQCWLREHHPETHQRTQALIKSMNSKK